MICSKCKQVVYRAFSYTDSDGVYHREECENCYPLGKINSWSATEKLKSRSIAPDGRTILTGMAGIRNNDLKRRNLNPKV